MLLSRGLQGARGAAQVGVCGAGPPFDRGHAGPAQAACLPMCVPDLSHNGPLWRRSEPGGPAAASGAYTLPPCPPRTCKHARTHNACTTQVPARASALPQQLSRPLSSSSSSSSLAAARALLASAPAPLLPGHRRSLACSASSAPPAAGEETFQYKAEVRVCACVRECVRACMGSEWMLPSVAAPFSRCWG